MSQELVNSVNKLTDETSALLQEYVKGNTVLQNSASEAASSAAAAKVSEGITIDKANVATQKAAEAKQFRDETAAVATGGTATLDPTPGKIPLANAEAKLHAGWLPVNVSALSDAIVEAIRNVNKEQYAASGFIHTGTHYVHANGAYGTAVNEGLTCRWANTNYANTLWLGDLNDATYRVGESKTLYPLMNIAGHRVRLGLHYREVKFPQAPDGKVTFNKSTGVTTVHSDPAAAFAFAQGDTTGNTEVVINRVDMYGLEFWPREVTDGLYPFGDVQYQSASPINVPLTVNNDKPMSYFAAYPGDTSSRGTYWKLSELTFVQMAQVMNDPDTNAWYDESGKLIQFCFRQRTGLGAGNGDWGNIKPVSNDVLFNHGPIIKNRFSVQGELDDARVPSHANDGYFGSLSQKSRKELGVFSASPESPEVISLGNECYFYLLGTVPRLNQGAFHPSLNPMGAAEWIKQGDILGQWYLRPDFTKDTLLCFTPVTSATGSVGKRDTGKIGSTSGRSDGRLYDAIYASGQGGVIDWRLPARDMGGKEEAAKVFQQVVNGTYRGLEKLKRTWITPPIAQTPSYAATSIATKVGTQDLYKTGDVVSLYDITTNQVLVTTVITGVRNGAIDVRDTFSRLIGEAHIVVTTETNISVSSNFTQLNVLGSPLDILATLALAGGWGGTWINNIPDGTTKQFAYSRKNISKVGDGTDAVTTTNRGGTWSASGISTTPNTDNIFGGSGQSVAAGVIYVIPYTAFAKQTRPSTNKAVFNASEGLGDVWASGDNYLSQGNGLIESLLGKVGKDNQDGNQERRYTLKQYQIAANALKVAANPNTHEPIDLKAPINDSPAVKTLWYQTSDNQRLGLSFAYNELVWNPMTTQRVLDSGATLYTAQNGILYRFENAAFGSYQGLTVRCLRTTSLSAGTLPLYFTRYDNYIIDGNMSAAPIFEVVKHGRYGWGDDSTVRIVDGQSTFINLNGDLCLYGTDELAMPYGYTKNQAGAGKQVVGVDL
ncbi:TPA: hypothetical protein I7251_13905 [Vibrio vulnificus]|nr:hypothetical protein [Vibrio vulnificus]HAS6423230.1 hypothetical protein [Vibrio vulnificus]